MSRPDRRDAAIAAARAAIRAARTLAGCRCACHLTVRGRAAGHDCCTGPDDGQAATQASPSDNAREDHQP